MKKKITHLGNNYGYYHGIVSQFCHTKVKSKIHEHLLLKIKVRELNRSKVVQTLFYKGL